MVSKLLGDGLDISKKTGRNFTIIFILSMLIIFDRGEIRLRAQEISARTITVHGDTSENILGYCIQVLNIIDSTYFITLSVANESKSFP